MKKCIVCALVLAQVGCSAQVIQLGHDESLTTILKQNNAIVKFFAPWCSGCTQLAPKFDALSEKNSKVTFIAVDVDVHRALAQQYKIFSIPCCLCFKGGKLISEKWGRIVGPNIKQITDALEKLIK